MVVCVCVLVMSQWLRCVMALRGRNVLQDSRRMGVWCVGRAWNDSASRQLEMKLEQQPSRSTFDLALPCDIEQDYSGWTVSADDLPVSVVIFIVQHWIPAVTFPVIVTVWWVVARDIFCAVIWFLDQEFVLSFFKFIQKHTVRLWWFTKC